MNAHRIVGKVAHAAPHVGVVAGGGRSGGDVVGEARLEAAPAAGLDESENGDEESAAPDEDELENLVEDGRPQAAERRTRRRRGN